MIGLIVPSILLDLWVDTPNYTQLQPIKWFIMIHHHGVWYSTFTSHLHHQGSDILCRSVTGAKKWTCVNSRVGISQQKSFQERYPLVNVYVANWKIIISKFRKSTVNRPCSIAMLVYHRVHLAASAFLWGKHWKWSPKSWHFGQETLPLMVNHNSCDPPLVKSPVAERFQLVLEDQQLFCLLGQRDDSPIFEGINIHQITNDSFREARLFLKFHGTPGR